MTNKRYESDVISADSVFTNAQTREIINDYSNDKVPISCYLCNSDTQGFIILNCNHIFHIKCIVDFHQTQTCNIDEDYIKSLTCSACKTPIQMDELQYIYSKYTSNSDKILNEYTHSIEGLETQLKSLKDEIRTCFEYKYKIQQSREKSKQILSMISMMD